MQDNVYAGFVLFFFGFNLIYFIFGIKIIVFGRKITVISVSIKCFTPSDSDIEYLILNILSKKANTYQIDDEPSKKLLL